MPFHSYSYTHALKPNRSVEYSHHEFKETGFSPILAGGYYCEGLGEEEEDGYDEENCHLFEEEEWSGWGDACALHRRGSFRRPASSPPDERCHAQGGVGDKLYVTGVMTAACCRRQGLGASLLRAVEEHAQALRTPYLCMFVEPSNAPALALYTQKAGYNLVPYSPTAEAFAGKIGLYKGPYAARQYSFVYKRLELLDNADPKSSSSSTSLAEAQAARPLPFPGRMPALRNPLFS